MHTVVSKLFISLLVLANVLFSATVILNEGDFIESGEVMDFPAANAYIALQGDGNLVLYRGAPGDSTAVIWASTTPNGPDDYHAVMQGDGNLVIYRGTRTDTNKSAIYTSLSVNGEGDYFFGLNDDERLVIGNGNPNGEFDVIWSNIKDSFNINSILKMGEIVVNKEGTAFMLIQGDGNMVAYQGTGWDDPNKQAIWSTGTSTGAGSYFMNFQSDGNMVLRTGIPQNPGTVLWASQTETKKSFLTFDTDGLPVVKSGSVEAPGAIRWKAESKITPTLAFVTTDGTLYQVLDYNINAPIFIEKSSVATSVKVAQDVIYFTDHNDNLKKFVGNQAAIQIQAGPIDEYYVNRDVVAFTVGNQLKYHNNNDNSAAVVSLGLFDTSFEPVVDNSGSILFLDLNGDFKYVKSGNVQIVPTYGVIVKITLSDNFVSWIAEGTHGHDVYQWDGNKVKTIINSETFRTQAGHEFYYTHIAAAGQYVYLAKYDNIGAKPLVTYLFNGKDEITSINSHLPQPPKLVYQTEYQDIYISDSMLIVTYLRTVYPYSGPYDELRLSAYRLDDALNGATAQFIDFSSSRGGITVSQSESFGEDISTHTTWDGYASGKAINLGGNTLYKSTAYSEYAKVSGVHIASGDDPNDSGTYANLKYFDYHKSSGFYLNTKVIYDQPVLNFDIAN